MEKRFLGDEVKIEDRIVGDAKKRTIYGYGAVFYDPNDPGTEYRIDSSYFPFRERIMPGAFDRALREGDDVRGLFNHNPSMILGRTAAGTMTLSIDRKGLRYSIDPPDTQYAQDVVKMLERGDVTGSSFSFKPEEVVWREIKEGEKTVTIREIVSCKLFDVCPVTYPAYESASSDVRHAVDANEAKASYEKWAAERSKVEPAKAPSYETLRRRLDLAKMEV